MSVSVKKGLRRVSWLRGFILIGPIAILNLSLGSQARAQSAATDGTVQVAQFLRLEQPSDRPAAAGADDALEGIGEGAKPASPRSSRARRPDAESPDDEAAADQPKTIKPRKPAPVVAQRLVFPKTGPLPPHRPWGERDAFTEGDVVASAPDTQLAPVSKTAAPPAAPAVATIAPVLPAAAKPNPAPNKPALPAPDQAVVILVRNEVTRPQDLQGRKVALGPTSATADDLRGVVQANAGVTVEAVPLNWTSGLQGLARGEIDGVLLSVGPKMSAEEVTSVALGPYKLLEIPIQKLAN